ncbi:MAG: ATP-dependent helicase [Verrucomicrobiales bacterium]
MIQHNGLIGLNPPQREAAETISGPVLILAGAGTGKTRVVTTRIAGMIFNDIPACEILAVTFTNKAATEMRERVATMISQKAAGEVTICTFHSLCVRILRTCIERLGYKKNFSIYTQSDQLGLLKKIIVRTAGKDEKLDPKMANMEISGAKNRGEIPGDFDDSLIRIVYENYQRDLKQMNAVDFDDLMLLAVRGLEENPDLRKSWQRHFRYIMVDEFQDTNHLQMTLLRLIVGKERNICVVGDDDQSIYGWRGADITNILDFERFFKGPKIVKLEENYRSTNTILRLANSLIRHNIDRREKTLWSSKEDGERTKLISMPDAETEAEWIVNEVHDEHRMHDRSYNDFAILFRMNAQSRIFEEQFRELEIPYKLIGGQSFYERREVKDVLAYLSVITNNDDDVSLLRIIASPPRGIGGGTIEAATTFSIERQSSVYDALQDIQFQASLPKRAQNAIGRFHELIQRYSEFASNPDADYAEMTTTMLKEINYDEYVKKNCKTPDEADMRRKNVHEFLEGMHFSMEKKKKRGLRGFLDGIALMQDREERGDEKEQGHGVSLITMHASKGLEFPCCFIVGAEEGTLPHSRSVEEGTRDEERRLLYVGITRAQERLTITWCHSRRKYGDPLPCMPSSFFKELDPEELEKVDYKELADAPVDEDSALDYFARMKEMLSQ